MKQTSSKSGTSSQTSSQLSKPGVLPWRPLAAILIVLGIYFGAQIITEIILSLAGASAGDDSGSAATQFAFVAVVEAITLVLLYVVLTAKSKSFKDLGLIRPRLRDLGATLVSYPIYFLINWAALLAATALFHFDADQKQYTGFESAAGPEQLVLTFISLVILPPIVEEIVMRGYLFGALRNGLSVVKAAAVTSVIFAVAHLQFGNGAPLLWLAAIDTFVLSLVLCYLRIKTGSLWAGIGLHMLKNGLAFWVLFIAPEHWLYT